MNSLKLILAILVIASSNIIGQPYYSFPDSNVIWSIEGHNNFYNSQYHIRYGIIGDTIINSKIYNKIYQLYDSTLTNPLSTYKAALREENKNVFAVIDTFPEYLMYDFNLLVGDSIEYFIGGVGGGANTYFYPDTFYRYVNQIDSILLLDGNYRKLYHLNCDYNTPCYVDDIWIEGIGSINHIGLFNPFINDIITGGDGWTFSCFKQNDTVLYLNNPLCNKCFCSLYVNIGKNELTEETISVFPNPSNECTKLIFNGLTKSIYSLTIYNSIGEIQLNYNGITDGEITICKGQLKNGLYIYKLMNEQGIIKTGRLIIN